MTTVNWSDRAARGYAILRGVMLLVFMAFFVISPDVAVPGSSAEPARSLGLMFASRTILLGVAFLALALRRQRSALAWLLVADAVLQVFDTGLSISMGKGAMSIVPAALGLLDVWAAVALRRTDRTATPS